MQRPPDAAHKIAASLDMLELGGPALAGQRVKLIRGSRHHNMKELRSVGGSLRALFAFDRSRRAIVLVGGEETNNWNGWYKQHIPLADRLYDQHPRNQGREVTWQAIKRRAGARSVDNGR